MSKEDFQCKLVVVGVGGVGKSSITLVLVKNTFGSEYNPTIEDSYQKIMKIDDCECTLDILDTAGQDEYSALREQYVRQGNGFLVVYAVNSAASLERAPKFLEQIYKVKQKRELPIILVGNKKDLEGERVVSLEQGQALAKKHDTLFREVSAKTAVGITEIFEELIRDIWVRGPSEVAEEAPWAKNRKCSIL